MTSNEGAQTDLTILKRLDRAAYDYNLSRSAVLNARPEGLTASVERVLSVVTGLWVALVDDECVPEKGKHGEACAHRENLIPATASDLARLTFGETRGRGGYVTRTKQAMDDLALWRGRSQWPEAGRYVIRTGGILSTLSRDGSDLSVPEIPGNRQFLIAFDPFLHRDLLDGHFQYIPVDVVQSLTGLAFKLYSAVVSGAATVRVVRGDQPDAEYSITGPNPKLPPSRLGIGASASESEIEERLLASVEHINAAQDDYQFALWPRADEGIKVKVWYSKVSKVVLKGIQSGTQRYTDQDQNGVSRRIKDSLKTISTKTHEENGQISIEDHRQWVRQSLEAKWNAYGQGRPVSDAQLGLIAIYADIHSPKWVEDKIASCPTGRDPIEFLKGQYLRAERHAAQEREDAYRSL